LIKIKYFSCWIWIKSFFIFAWK